MKKFIVKKISLVNSKENTKPEYLFYLNNDKKKFK